MDETCLIIIHDPRPGIELGTFGLVDECSTTELTPLLLKVDVGVWSEFLKSMTLFSN